MLAVGKCSVWRVPWRQLRGSRSLAFWLVVGGLEGLEKVDGLKGSLTEHLVVEDES